MKSNTLTFITSLTVILELWIPCKTKQESFDVVTNLQLHAVERWECQMTQFKWQFWTWKMSKQKYSELNYTLIDIYLFGAKHSWPFVQCVDCQSTLYYKEYFKSKFVTTFVKQFINRYLCEHMISSFISSCFGNLSGLLAIFLFMF